MSKHRQLARQVGECLLDRRDTMVSNTFTPGEIFTFGEITSIADKFGNLHVINVFTPRAQ